MITAIIGLLMLLIALAKHSWGKSEVWGKFPLGEQRGSFLPKDACIKNHA